MKSRVAKTHSDSEGSIESNSLSVDSNQLKTVKDAGKPNKRRRGSEWEILEGLREGQRYENKPQVFTGYLHKKRKWPLKGWHKRYFVIDKGILVYARGPSDITRGKIHGSVDIGLSVISTKSKSRRIDIDAEEFIYHLKAKRLDNFMKWLEQLRKHRLFRQHLLTFGARETACNDCDNSVNYHPNSISLTPPNLSPSRESSLPRGLLGNSPPIGGRLAVWLIDSSPVLDGIQKDLKQVGHNIAQLSKILEHMSSLSVVTEVESTSDGLSPNVKKDRKKFGLRKKKSNKGSSVDLASSPNDGLIPSSNASASLSSSPQAAMLSSSQTCLITNASHPASANRPQSLPGPEFCLPQYGNSLDVKNLTPEFQLREDYVVLAKDVCSDLKSAYYKLATETDRLKTACETESSQLLNVNSPNLLVSLRHSLNQALVMNNDLKNRLKRVHEIADLADISSACPIGDGKPLACNLSYSSSCLSASEFFDAEDNQSKYEETEKKDGRDNTDSSSENNSLSSEEGEENSISSENSEVGADYSITRDSSEAPVSCDDLCQPDSRLTLYPSDPLVDMRDCDTIDSDLCPTSEVIEESSTSQFPLIDYETGLPSKSMCRYYILERIQMFPNLSAAGIISGQRMASREISVMCCPLMMPAAGMLAQYLDCFQNLLSEMSKKKLVSEEINFATGRRTKLPAPRPNTEGLSLWNILCKNIGKDLSQVSMPVTLNEPLSMLQRMCEELEYSDLLDKAAELEDPYERMVYVAAFAVSSYGSSYYRAGSKPFNPLLGETYECIRDDKGFKYVAEQVSHHPPISVCHAESKNFVFWQDVRIKTKFWGKSMEFQPAGTTNVRFPATGEEYQWNKVTTCVHNLFSGQRWVDQYGELKVTSSSGITCKMTFVKASYWSTKRHEVHGTVTSKDGKVVKTLFGKWSEAIYCGVAPSAKCIWRPGTMPTDHDLYYGFTRFAMELNELNSEMAKYLPPTDTRFRPDQRLLEEGDVAGAENLKLVLEQSQRERERKRREEDSEASYEARWFSSSTAADGEQSWTYNNKYWEMRKNPGFSNMEFELLW